MHAQSCWELQRSTELRCNNRQGKVCTRVPGETNARAMMITLDMGALTITLVTTITITRAMMITMAQYILA